MKTSIRLLAALLLSVTMISATGIKQSAAQTIDLRFETTINVGAGTGGADQLEVAIQVDTDVDYQAGNANFRFFYNTDGLQLPSMPAGPNTPLVEDTDFAFSPPFNAGLYGNSSATTYATVDNISADLILGFPDFGSDISAAAGWVTIVTLWFDILDDQETEQLTWKSTAPPNPTQAFDGTDNTTPIVIDMLMDSDKSLDPLMAVELSTFASVVNDGAATVRWTTVSEANSAGFAVEVAPKATGDFNQVGYVNGAGTSDTPQNYAFALDGLDAGVYRVRLKQVNLDGSFDYSPELEVSIQLGEAYRLGNAYPSPFATSASFTLAVRDPQPVQIDVFNLLGQKVQSVFDGELGGNQSRAFTIDGASLSNGIYIVRAKGASFAATSTVAVLK